MGQQEDFEIETPAGEGMINLVNLVLTSSQAARRIFKRYTRGDHHTHNVNYHCKMCCCRFVCRPGVSFRTCFTSLSSYLLTYNIVSPTLARGRRSTLTCSRPGKKKEVVFKSVPVPAKTHTHAYEYVFLQVCFGFPYSSAYT